MTIKAKLYLMAEMKKLNDKRVREYLKSQKKEA